MKEKKLIILLILIIILLAGVSLVTYSWYKWTNLSSDDISVSLAGGSRITFHGGPEVSETLTPVSSYSDGVTKKIEVTSDTSGNTFDLHLTINQIDNELKNSAFKWAIYKDNNLVNSGDFATCNSGDDLILLDNAQITSGINEVYNVYFWIDGNVENSSNMANKTVDMILYASGTSGGDSTVNIEESIHKYMMKRLFSSSANGYFWESSIKANQVKSINFTSMENKPNNVSTYDISLKSGTGNVLMWYVENGTTEGDNPITLYDVYIASGANDHKVYANYNANSLFAYLTNCQTMNLSYLDTRSVNNMSLMFHKCTSLTSLDVSNFDTSNVTNMYFMFNQCERVTSLDLSTWDMSKVTNDGVMFQKVYDATDIRMPNNYTRIDNFMFNHNYSYTGSSFTIPASVNFVGYTHMFYTFGSPNEYFTTFIVENGNTAVKAIDGILYSYDGTRLIAVPRGKRFTNSVFTIPEGVTEMNECSFSKNNHILTLVIPNSYTIVRDNTIYADSKGYINNGNSLNAAIYHFTSIKSYEVKSDNPNYMSYDGCIYSKDGTELITVPLKYNGTLNIKEGTTKIGINAFNGTDANYYNFLTDINIPASVTTIESDQITAINKIVTTKSVNVTVDANNVSYQVSNNQLSSR